MQTSLTVDVGKHPGSVAVPLPNLHTAGNAPSAAASCKSCKISHEPLATQRVLLDPQHGRHLGACKERGVSALNLKLLNHNLHVNKVPYHVGNS